MRSLFVALVVLHATPGWAKPPADSIVGTWRGTSLCVNRKAAPACTDEQALYRITAKTADAVVLEGNKIVHGKVEFMGEFRPTFDASTGTWVAVFEGPRKSARLRLKVADGKLTGTMSLLPDDIVIRRIELTKE